MSAEVVIARSFIISVEDAAARLLKYEPTTVWNYDLGCTTGPRVSEGGINIFSDPDAITLEDLGRISVIDAQLRGWGAVKLLEPVDPALWRAVPYGARLEVAAANPTGSLYLAADALYAAFLGDTARGAWVSKVLHLKRPGLFPILDSRQRNMYREVAAEAMQRLRGRRRGHLYWVAIGDDVAANASALSAVRGRWARDLQSGTLTVHEAEQARRLLLLSDLRLLDALAWGIDVHENPKNGARRSPLATDRFSRANPAGLVRPVTSAIVHLTSAFALLSLSS